MKYLVIGKPRAMATGPSSKVLQAHKEYLNSLRAKGILDCVYAFLDEGGFGILNADSPEKLRELMIDAPMYPFAQWEICALSDFNASIDKMTEMLRKQGM